MLKISFVVGSGSEEDNARMVASRRRKVKEHFALTLEKNRQTLHLAITNLLRENSRQDRPIFPGVTCATRSLSAVRQDPPLPIRGAAKVTREQMQIHL